MRSVHTILALARGAAVGLILGAIPSVVLLQQATSVSASVYSPLWVLNPLSSCSDWKNDNSFYPGSSTVRFSDYWSGKPAYWNYPSANACWHNDGGSWAPAIDLPASAGTEVKYRSYVNGPYQWSSTFFRAGSCGGYSVDVYTPDGFLAGVALYWQMSRYSGVVNTYGTTITESWPNTLGERAIGTVASPGTSGCTNTGAHLHLGLNQGGWAQPNKDGAVTWGPMNFGW